MKASFEIPSVLCFVHLPDKPFDFMRYELPFCPFIGMEIMDEHGDLYVVKRVIFEVLDKAVQIYCKPFEPEKKQND